MNEGGKIPEDEESGAEPHGASTPIAGDPLALTELFRGGGEPWLPLLKPTIEGLAGVEAFIGPGRGKGIVPVRELTFQALKPNPPGGWKVVVFGQNPYPRVESATGIAMFDNTFHQWKDSQFGRVMSIRCIIKAACIWKHGIAKQTSIAEIRQMLAETTAVQPPEWFQAMLTQGVLLLNAALTASSDGLFSTEQHTAFWRPVVERIIEEILQAKRRPDAPHRGVVFAWWGSHARALRSVVERLERKYPGVAVKHVDHCNPAAQGDIFCNGNHFGDVNRALGSIGLEEVELAAVRRLGPCPCPAAGRRRPIGRGRPHGRFHRPDDRVAQVLSRPASGGQGRGRARVAGDHRGGGDAVDGLPRRHRAGRRQARDAQVVRAAFDRVRDEERRAGPGRGPGRGEIAALYLYTTGSVFYRQLNAMLRDPDRARVTPYLGYLRLLFSALSKLASFRESLWRGVALDLRVQYPKGGVVTWWGVSSCTAKLSVARGFLGLRGRRTLFEVIPSRAVSISKFSAFTGEDEYILAPGTRLKVTSVKAERDGLCTIGLEEFPVERLVS